MVKEMKPFNLGTMDFKAGNLVPLLVLVSLSLVFALMLSITQMPYWLAWARPAWVAMVIIYWVVALPHRVGVMTAWFAGLFLDVLQGNVLGQHASGLAIVAFLAFLLHLRLRVFPLWQQCLTVFILVGIYQLTVRIIEGFVGFLPETPLYWLPTLVSAIVWPVVLSILRFFTQKYRVY